MHYKTHMYQFEEKRYLKNLVYPLTTTDLERFSTDGWMN
jgi:hypothetical protein